MKKGVFVNFLKLTIIAITFLVCSGQSLFAEQQTADSKPNPISLGIIDGESSDKMSVVTIRLNSKPEWETLPKIEAHGSFMQIELPNTIAPEPGKFFDGNSPIIKKIVVLQISPNKSAVRMFLSHDANIVKEASEVEILDKRLVITTDHNGVKNNIAKTPLLKINDKDDKTLMASQADLPPENPTPPVQEQQHQSPIAGSPFHLKEHLSNIAVFFAVMFLMLIASWGLKPIMARRRLSNLATGQGPVEMKLLNSLPVAAKQKLSLVQIGNQQILIAISPDQVNLITKIDNSASSTNTLSQSHQNTLRVRPSIQQIQAAGLNNGESTFNQHLSKSIKNSQPVVETKKEENNLPPQTNLGRGDRINLAIGDNGIEEKKHRAKSSKNPKTSTVADSPVKSIEDVTKLIREKLKNLPKS
jgi:flagellar biogenesis protein FliO